MVQIDRRTFLQMTILSFVTAATACTSDSQTGKTVPEVDSNWGPGPETYPHSLLSVADAEGHYKYIDVHYHSGRRVTVNIDTLAKFLTVFEAMGGILPEQSFLAFTDNGLPPDTPQEAFSATYPSKNIIFISMDRIRKSHQLTKFTDEQNVNGALISELANLMFVTANTLPVELIIDGMDFKDNVQYVDDSFGVMASAIVAGKSYDEYADLVSNKGIVYMGDKKILLFSRVNYENLGKMLVEPLAKLD